MEVTSSIDNGACSADSSGQRSSSRQVTTSIDNGACSTDSCGQRTSSMEVASSTDNTIFRGLFWPDYKFYASNKCHRQ